MGLNENRILRDELRYIREDIDFVKRYYASSSGLEMLLNKVEALQQMLIQAGILVPVSEHKGIMYHVKGQLYKVKEEE